jgi:CPA2 family monovalent cation:H+ antiporter-2
LNPILYRSIGWLEAALAKLPWLRRVFNRRTTPAVLTAEDVEAGAAYRAVIVGYGPIGRTVARLLRGGGIEPVIVETNLETTRKIRDQGYRAVYGDAAQADVLEAAGIRSAVALIVSGPSPEQSAEIIRNARHMNSEIRLLARSSYLKETSIMRSAGADEVFSGEGEVALAMTEYVLGFLGATPEQMDRERERAREAFRLRADSQV